MARDHGEAGWRRFVSNSSSNRVDDYRCLGRFQANESWPLVTSRVTVNSVLQVSCPWNRSADGFDGLELVVKVGLEMQFHDLGPHPSTVDSRQLRLCRSRSGSSMASVATNSSMYFPGRLCLAPATTNALYQV